MINHGSMAVRGAIVSGECSATLALPKVASMCNTPSNGRLPKNYLLTVPGMRATHSILDWVMGRMERVEVLLPVELRDQVSKRILAMHRRYQIHGFEEEQ